VQGEKGKERGEEVEERGEEGRRGEWRGAEGKGVSPVCIFKLSVE